MSLTIPLDLLPIPKTLLQWTWSIIGYSLGGSCGTLDQQEGLDEILLKYGKFEGFTRWLVERALHFIHHYWIGLLLMAYFCLLHHIEEIYWLGYGLLIEDAGYHIGIVPEIEKRINMIRGRRP